MNKDELASRIDNFARIGKTDILRSWTSLSWSSCCFMCFPTLMKVWIMLRIYEMWSSYTYSRTVSYNVRNSWAVSRQSFQTVKLNNLKHWKTPSRSLLLTQWKSNSKRAAQSCRIQVSMSSETLKSVVNRVDEEEDSSCNVVVFVLLL